ncbi:MAG: hypothetical protein Q8N53_15450, partial [Longimicrobiales bacterium]|nr:hypothetical protein [Longimicrobiales bacterium]
EAVKLEGFDRVTGVTAAGDLAYVFWSPVPTARNVPRVTVVDVSAPGGPRVVGELEGVFATWGALAGDRLWLWGGSGGLSVLDVSDASQPRILSEPPPEPPRGSRTVSTLDIDDSVSLLVDGTRLYLLLYGGDWGVYRWRLQVLDISDPAQPKEIGSVEGRGVPAGMWLQGQQVVVADSYGMSVVDVSNPALPQEKERVPAGAPGDVFLRGEHAFLFTQGGLFALDLSRPESPSLAAFRYFGPIGSASDLGGNRFRAAVYGEYRGYEIDLSDPYQPRLEEYRSSGPPAPRATLGPYTLWAGCGRLNVEDPTQRRGDLMTVAQVRLTESNCGDKWDVAAVDQDVYVVGNGRLYLFDASDPNSPKLIAEKPLTEGGEEATRAQAHVTIADGRAYVLHGGLWVLDLSAPLQPREVAYYPTDALTLDVEGDSIALAGPDGSFELLQLELER